MQCTWVIGLCRNWFMYEQHPKIAVTHAPFELPSRSLLTQNVPSCWGMKFKSMGAVWSITDLPAEILHRMLMLASWKNALFSWSAGNQGNWQEMREAMNRTSKVSKWRQCLNLPLGLPGVTSYVQLCLCTCPQDKVSVFTASLHRDNIDLHNRMFAGKIQDVACLLELVLQRKFGGLPSLLICSSDPSLQVASSDGSGSRLSTKCFFFWGKYRTVFLRTVHNDYIMIHNVHRTLDHTPIQIDQTATPFGCQCVHVHVRKRTRSTHCAEFH